MLKLNLLQYIYFPTSRDEVIEVEGMHMLLQVLLDNCVSRGVALFLVGISTLALDVGQEITMLTCLDPSASLTAMLKAWWLHMQCQRARTNPPD